MSGHGVSVRADPLYVPAPSERGERQRGQVKDTYYHSAGFGRAVGRRGGTAKPPYKACRSAERVRYAARSLPHERIRWHRVEPVEIL